MTADNFGPEFFRAQGWWRDETLRDWVARQATKAPDHPAVLAGTSSSNYLELHQRAQACAAGLHRLGLRRGDVVAVHLPNLPEFLIAWLAINEIGASMPTVHTPYGPRELAHLLRHGEARACIALAKSRDRSPASDLVALRAEVPSLRHVISVGGAVEGAEPFASMLDRGAREPGQAQAIAATDPFVLLFTSGTTSSPKAVAVTYNHFLSNAPVRRGVWDHPRGSHPLSCTLYPPLRSLRDSAGPGGRRNHLHAGSVQPSGFHRGVAQAASHHVVRWTCAHCPVPPGRDV
jgi:acyl-CoA synthetase (AMP-forming)/AMP-acid ligase II